MSLTIGAGPLASGAPKTVNYTIDSPRHSLFMEPFPRRVRAEVAGRTVLDSDRGYLLHETNLLPVLYVPDDDIRQGLLRPSDHTTHCPFKGDAAYRHITVGERFVRDAVWSYPEAREEAYWLRGLAAVAWDAADAWFDEDERVHGHLRDPYHRVDTRRSSTLVRISVGEAVVALSANPVVLSETGLPNRHYLPPDDVRREFLTPSTTRTYCPYKGGASYWNIRVGDREIADAAWSIPNPLKDGHDVRDHFCFLHDEVTTTLERA
ncbi:uncharacterized protein (DUF427 family) [Nocardiopsis mwathae]|uniref:Uncharacterized protein (DUF427 family) n=1 Tax=Nocardiopsis mwathae TaxID=1472723 RepID=A0A7W9YIJ3_9ACTN|nr:DUF427 domain-containing protein [Nocardiopsis mwathae]MBB6172808.1 uncharacterized protein (DUF427 family) [Nocardiopsis mwathae]